jgi:hypothetical protein
MPEEKEYRRAALGRSAVLRAIARFCFTCLLMTATCPQARAVDPSPKTYDVVVYGGTASGCVAAIQAAQMGKSVALIEPGQRLGGMTTCGLSFTDIGNPQSVGGLAREFYQKIGTFYGKNEAVFAFEPKVALSILNDWVGANHVAISYGERLDLHDGVVMKNGVIDSLRMESGMTFLAKMYIDATYEGDLLALAHISYTKGRESNEMYGETLNGIREKEQFPLKPNVNPYVVSGDSASGLLPFVHPDRGGAAGAGDHKIQAYNFRLCLTRDPSNRKMIAQPPNYNPLDYELFARTVAQGQRSCLKLKPIPGNKFDCNNDGCASTDAIGQVDDYPDGDYSVREGIFNRIRDYDQGLIWTLQNDPRIAPDIRKAYGDLGLAADEFTTTNGWPPQMYEREARRLVGDTVIDEKAVLGKTPVTDSVGLGSYAMDSHHTQYYVGADGFVHTEGAFFKTVNTPYPISYRALVPKVGECENLLVSVAVSATHAAYGSIRMEPVLMVLGQSAGAAACLALDAGCPVQKVDYAKLQAKLAETGQVLEWGAAK